MKKISVIGSGYVGLVTGTCFAELGNQVACIDTNQKKIDDLNDGRVPFFEPGLEELVSRNSHAGRLHFTSDLAAGIAQAECIFIAVGTPMADNGEADLSYVRYAVRQIAEALDHDAIIVNKSTVPVETGDMVAALVVEHRRHNINVSVVSNPEFLREGSAISDFMQPDRVVLGVSNDDARKFMLDLYEPLKARIFVTDVRTAEMIKYTANAFLATKISFINEIANLCECVGANVLDVVEGAGSDTRIGTFFLQPGLGFGGSCFPKDVSALNRIAEKCGLRSHILPAVLDVNKGQIERVYAKIEAALDGAHGRKIAILGLAFKPNTDDVRESPPIALIKRLLSGGASVAAHDPEALDTARLELGDAISYFEDIYKAVAGADAIVVATDWNEYKQLDFGLLKKAMNGDVLLDARNIYDPALALRHGFRYYGVGRHGQPKQANGELADPAALENA